MAEAIDIPVAPRKVQFPKTFRDHESFTCLTAKVLQVIESLPPHQWKELSGFMKTVLYPGVAEDNMPAIPSSPKEIMMHLRQYCDFLNKDSLVLFGRYLNNYDVKDCGLARQLSESDRIFSDDLKQATWDIQVDVAPPPAYKIMLVKKLGNTTVREAVEVRDFLSENLMLKGQRGILHLAGLANDSLVFYVSEGNVGSMLQRMQYKKDRMLAEGLVQVTFVKLVHLEVESGHITPDPHVPKLDQAAECPEFSVLLIGETGSGKSTLINNLLGEDVALEGHSMANPGTAAIQQYRGTVAGVPVVLYDTPGTDDRKAASDTDVCKEIKKLIKSKKVCLTIFCFSMNEQRIKRSHILTLQAYNKASVNWKNSIVALTFADQIKAPHKERRNADFNPADYFQRKIAERTTELRSVLAKEVSVPQFVAENLIMRPTTDEWDSPLPDNQEWFIPLWLDILDLLEPAAYFRLLEIHRGSITFEDAGEVPIREMSITGEKKDRLQKITKKKLEAIAATTTNAASTTMCLGLIVSTTGIMGATAAGEIIYGLGSMVTTVTNAFKRVIITEERKKNGGRK